jgi:uncharacterized coiled-coil protein SlyX
VTDEVIKTLIGAGVSVTVAIVGVIGIWLGRKPSTERRRRGPDQQLEKQRVEFEKEKAAFYADIRKDMAELRQELKALRDMDLAKGQRIAALEATIQAKDTRIAELTVRVSDQENEIADLKTQIELLKYRETRRQ